MNIERYFPHTVITTLVVLSAVPQSPAIAAAAVVGLGLVLGRDAYEKAKDAAGVKVALPEEAKRKIQDLEARVLTIEYGIKQRGF